MISERTLATVGTVSRGSTLRRFVEEVDRLLDPVRGREEAGAPGARALLPRGPRDLVALYPARYRFGALLRAGRHGFSVTPVEAVRDPELPGIARVLTAESLDELGLDGGGGTLENVQWIAYRPFRRAQLRVVSGEGRTFYMRIERPRKAARRAAAQRWVEEALPVPAAGITLPRLLGVDEEAGLLVTEEVAGMRLLEALGRPGARSEVRRVGRALRAFHRIPVAGEGRPLREIRWGDALADLHRFARTLDGIGCRRTNDLRDLADRLKATAPPGSSPSIVHGDLHEKQILLGEGVGLVDLDLAGVGDPCADLGNLRAQLRLRGLQGLAAEPVPRLLHALDSGYGNPPGEGGADRREAWETISLVRLAGVYSLRPRWCYLVDPLLRIADKLQTGRERRRRKGTCS